MSWMPQWAPDIAAVLVFGAIFVFVWVATP